MNIERRGAWSVVRDKKSCVIVFIWGGYGGGGGGATIYHRQCNILSLLGYLLYSSADNILQRKLPLRRLPMWVFEILF